MRFNPFNKKNDIKKIAVEMALDRISDGYLIINEEGRVVSFNRAFAGTFGAAFGIEVNTDIYSRGSQDGPDASMGIYTLLASVDSCRESGTTISYEQSLTLDTDENVVIKYYMVDVSMLRLGGGKIGFVVFFKDISSLKESMRNLNSSQKRLVENERLAFLGQMLGGISHNLKTPIMSISGTITAVGKLIDECMISIDDPDVTKDDYLEIYSEIRQWMSRAQEACAYMSDIITTVKEQATNLNTTNDAEFTMDEVIKRVSLLLRHEFLSYNCTLKITSLVDAPMAIMGDINSMVQVVNNLVINSIDAVKNVGGEIEIELSKDENNYLIKVKDHGPGIEDEVKKHLFKKMITSKGAMGSGLGIYMSNSFVRARFDGQIWFEDNPGGGAVFIISLPIKNAVSTDETIISEQI